MTATPAWAPVGTDGDLPPGLDVVGGAGGTRAHICDLEAAAAALDRAAVSLEAAAAHAETVMNLVGEAARWSAGTTPGARASMVRLVSRRQGLRMRADLARGTASSLRGTAELYARTDLDVASLLSGGGVVAGGVVGELGPLGWAAAGALTLAGGIALVGNLVGLRLLRYAPSPLGAVLRTADAPAAQAADGPLGFTARMLGGPGLLPASLGLPGARTVEPLVPGMASFLLAAGPGRRALLGDPVPTAARTLSRATSGASLLIGTPTNGLVVAPVVTSDAPRGPSAASPLPRTTADLLRQVERLYPNPPGTRDQDGDPDPGGTPGTVSVQRLDHGDGTRSWVVAIPGQETAALGGPDPRDMTSNLQLMAGLPDDATELVTRAMTLAGIEPGEPVVLAGHSQGGMVAMNIASDPVLMERFTVAAVVTAGSPVADVGLQDGTQSLHVEHLQDLVPVLDGLPNPDDPQRTTVIRDLGSAPTASNRQAAGSPGGAHGIGAYVRTAEELDGLDAPSVTTFDAALAGVLGDGSATATTQRYVGVRVPEPVGVAAPGGGTW
ncbi:alpha/beta hydrolase [Cellulomonas sp. KRMCY2]|uniref:alpha/beta hydrolase n=1 Tax=Cellulomonas sp. KRMCY2 TaxID=1304865 RepID=UPI00045E70BA|nr:alpha/beta hydrolase [Cellulomonas sp. KRMCY2]